MSALRVNSGTPKECGGGIANGISLKQSTVRGEDGQWITAYAKSLVSNEHHNRRDMVRVLRGARQIKAFAEDFSDPVPLAHWVMSRATRSVVKRLRTFVGRDAAWAPTSR
jgi:hypothetical protein